MHVQSQQQLVTAQSMYDRAAYDKLWTLKQATSLQLCTKLSFLQVQDLNELMYPAGNTPQEAPAVGAPRSAVNTRRQTTDSARPRLPQHGSAAFVLEEPIVATQRMVHAGPRRCLIKSSLPVNPVYVKITLGTCSFIQELQASA